MAGPRAPHRSLLSSPATLAHALRSAGEHVDLLESALDLDGLGQRSFLGVRPLAVAVAEPHADLTVTSGPAGLQSTWPGDPLRAAADLLAALRPDGWTRDPLAPFSGGGVLTLSYDLGRRFERLPSNAKSDADAPDLVLSVYERLLCWEGEEVRWVGAPPPDDLARMVTRATHAEDKEPSEPPGETACALTFDDPSYAAVVDAARGLIRRGDLFEVNLSRRWRREGVEPSRAYAALRRLAPAPFMADLDLGAGRRLLSASPERFLRLRGRRAQSWPIKGTRPRGASPEEDERLARELLSSEKDGAELAMIIDLVRNDLGRVATPGTVSVRDERRLQSWPTVHHTVGVVEAELDEGRTWDDLVRGAFPPGSITGAPKIRAMEVIDELEPVRRGLYCGAFGWVGWDDDLDLAVAIRVVPCAKGVADVHAGGAVVLDSDPQAEVAETHAKASALLLATGGGRACG